MGFEVVGVEAQVGEFEFEFFAAGGEAVGAGEECLVIGTWDDVGGAGGGEGQDCGHNGEQESPADTRKEGARQGPKGSVEVVTYSNTAK